MPVETEVQAAYFESDLNDVPKTKASFLSEKSRQLKRLLVHRNPLMPTGLLIFCLEYGKKDAEPLSGIFTTVRTRFHDLAETGLEEKMKGYYKFRNTYIAHQKERLVDVEDAKDALKISIETLQMLYAAGHGDSH